MTKRKAAEELDDFLTTSEEEFSDRVVGDDFGGLDVIAVIPEFNQGVVEYPLPVNKSIFPNGGLLNVVRRTPEQDVALSTSANFIPKHKREAE